MIWNYKQKNNKPVVRFSASKELLGAIPPPVPAGKAMPDWFRKIKPTMDGSDKADNGTIKRCMPVLDAVSQGYIIPLWADLQVKVMRVYDFKDAEGKIVHQEPTDKPDDFVGKTTEVTNELIESHVDTETFGVSMKFPDDSMIVGSHNWEQVGNACDLKKFKLGKILMKFINPWVIETAPGWSVKFQSPANNWSTSIQLIEGVVDTDEYHSEVNFPYVWTGSELGEFIIPCGTPLVHVIPFKRTDTTMEVGVTDQDKKAMVQKKLMTKFYDRYKTLFWSKRKQ